METTILEAEVRESRGKGPARRLRASGKLPGVVYGQGVSPTPLTLDPKPLTKALLGTYRRNTIFELNINGDKKLAMVKDLTVHPLKRDLLHVDFVTISKDSPIDIIVPFDTTGRAAGVVAGGKLNVMLRRLPVRTTADNVLAALSHDVTSLELFGTVTVADLNLPEGATVLLPPETKVVQLSENRRAVKVEGEDGAAEATE